RGDRPTVVAMSAAIGRATRFVTDGVLAGATLSPGVGTGRRGRLVPKMAPSMAPAVATHAPRPPLGGASPVADPPGEPGAGTFDVMRPCTSSYADSRSTS